MPRISYGTLVTLVGGVAHVYAHMFVLLYATVVLVLERQWGLDYASLFALALPGTVLYGLGALPAGWLADRWSANGMMAVFFFGLGAATLATGLAGGPLGLGIGLSAIGLFASIYHPVGIPWLVANVRNAGRALGVNGVFGSLGTAAAALVAGTLADLWSWRAAFFVPGLLSLATGLGFLWLLRTGRLEARREAAPAPVGQAAADMRRVFAVLAVTVTCTGLIYQATAYALPKVFQERLGDWAGGSVLGIGGFVTLCYAFSALTQLVGGELADRYRLKHVYLLCQAAQVPLYAVGFLLFGPALVPVAALLIGFNVMGQPTENSLLARHTPPQWRGKVFGAKFLLTLGVSSLGVALIPLIHAGLGNLDALFVALGAFAALAFAAACLLPAEAPRPAIRQAPAEAIGAGDD